PPQFGLEFLICCDDNVQSLAQALESDTELVLDGVKYNISGQIHIQRGGIVQNSDPTANSNKGTWVDTNITLGPIAPNIFHFVRWDYSYDRTAKSFRYLAFTFDSTK